MWKKSEYPFQRIHIDFCHVSEIGDVLVIVDAFSGWIDASAIKQRTSINVIHKLISFSIKYGFPEVLVSDNAPEFVSMEMNAWCQRNGVNKMESPPYHPQSNGTAERAVQTIKMGLKAWNSRITHTNFKIYLQGILVQHRTTARRCEGKSPAELVFGRKVRSPLNTVLDFGEEILYKSNNDSPGRKMKFLSSNGSNTSIIMDEEAQQIRLAHSNQIGRLPATTKEMETTEDETIETTEDETIIKAEDNNEMQDVEPPSESKTEQPKHEEQTMRRSARREAVLAVTWANGGAIYFRRHTR